MFSCINESEFPPAFSHSIFSSILFFVFGANPEDFIQVIFSFKYFLPWWDRDCSFSQWGHPLFLFPRDSPWFSPAVLVLGPVSSRSDGWADWYPPAWGRACWQPRNWAVSRGRKPIRLWTDMQWIAAGNRDLCGPVWLSMCWIWGSLKENNWHFLWLFEESGPLSACPCKNLYSVCVFANITVGCLEWNCVCSHADPSVCLDIYLRQCWASTYRWNKPKNIGNVCLLHTEESDILGN